MQWHILDTDRGAKPLTEAQISDLVGTGQINRETMLWADGMADWQSAELARPDLFPASTPPPPPPLPSQIARPGPRSTRKEAKPSGGGFLKKLVAGLVIMGALGIAAIMIGTPKRPPGYEGLKKMELSLSGATTRGSGESAAEQKAATMMAVTAEELRSMGISKDSGSTGRGLSGLARKAAAGMDANGFTAVCSVQGDTAIFLLHVPDLRKFADDAKDSMGTMAWLSACMAWQELSEPRPARICVGLKGIISYDRVLEGKPVVFSSEDKLSGDEPFSRGIETTTKGITEGMSKLCAYFAPPVK